MNFYYQKKKFHSLEANIFVDKRYDDDESGQGKTYGPFI